MLNINKVKRWTNTKAKLNMKHFIPMVSSCPVPWLSVGDVWHKVAIVDQWLLPAPARSPCLCLTSQLETWRCHASRVTCNSHVTGRTGQLPHTGPNMKYVHMEIFADYILCAYYGPFPPSLMFVQVCNSSFCNQLTVTQKMKTSCAIFCV